MRPIHIAAVACPDAIPVISFLLARGASATAPDSTGATPLDYAERRQIKENAAFLKTYTQGLNIKDTACVNLKTTCS